jgi:hypothetical protein
MDVRTAGKRVSPVERLSIVAGAGDRHAGAHRVTGAQQRPEVRLVGHPQRGDDQVIPTAVLAPAALVTQVGSPGLLARHHRPVKKLLVMFI